MQALDVFTRELLKVSKEDLDRREAEERSKKGK